MAFERKVNAPCSVEPVLDADALFYMRHGRPKPPRIYAPDRWVYDASHDQIAAVWKGRQSGQWVAQGPRGSRLFPTHAEAIAWAMKGVADA